MKKVLIMAALAFGIRQIQAQKISTDKVPPSVKEGFAKLYPKATSVKWDKEKTGYEASFDLNKVDNSVVLDANGKVLETEIAIKVTELPKIAAEYVAMHHKNAKVKETAKITDEKGVVTYEVGLKGKDLIFDSKGKFLKEMKD